MRAHPSFGEALRFWLKLGFISFGGPAGQIAIMHTELVERRGWIGEQRFLHALNFCMLLPGPEATQLATYCGWLLHRTWGGIAAGVLFVLPSVVVLWGLSYVYVTFGQMPWMAAAFDGLKPAVTAIVVAATLRIGSRALKNPVLWGIAGASFVAIFFFHVPFPAIVATAALAGFFGGKHWPARFPASAGHAATNSGSVIDDAHGVIEHTQPSFARSVRVTLISLGLWWLPVIGIGFWQGWSSTLAKEAFFFSKAAIVTFGGAYAVLPYVGQQAVEHYHWLSAPQMLDGLGLAETTPGPLIMVVQFVGFLGGWNQSGSLAPLVAATIGALITTWTTFVPCFFWIFLGAPYIEQMRGNLHLSRTLTAVTAAVVGVIANLAVWFAGHALFPSSKLDPTSPDDVIVHHADGVAIGVAIVAFVAMHRFKVGVIPVVVACAGIGLLRHALGG